MISPDLPELVIDWMKVNSRIDNPFWTRVQPLVGSRVSIWGSFTLGDAMKNPDKWYEIFKQREHLTQQYSWVITDPLTVDFIAKYCTRRVIDPIAGTGYLAYLLSWMGIRVVASDLTPPHLDEVANHWHRNAKTWIEVRRADAVAAAQMSVPEDTLLLSWPPFNDPIGFNALSAFAGNRLIYIGEGAGGCTGDDLFHALLESEWTEVDWQAPIQWDGIHDVVYVYDRIQAGDTS